MDHQQFQGQISILMQNNGKGIQMGSQNGSDLYNTGKVFFFFDMMPLIICEKNVLYQMQFGSFGFKGVRSMSDLGNICKLIFLCCLNHLISPPLFS